MRRGLKIIILQCKFFLMEWLNISYNLFPSVLSNYYLKLFGIKMGKGCSIHRNCKFFHVGNLSLGNHVVINNGCYLDNRRTITIGNNVGIAHNTKIYTLGHDINSPRFNTIGKPVTIEDNVFIFSNVLIMPGVTIHEGAIVLAGSVVTKDVQPYTIVGGNPAKFVKCRDEYINYQCGYAYIWGL